MSDDTTTQDPNPSGLCVCGCGMPVAVRSRNDRSRGWVKGHHCMYARGGHALKKSGPDYVVDESGCWVWQGAKKKSGYGVGWNGSRSDNAHRVYYRRFVGPIPEGMEIDHLCGNRSCVNPSHLQAVTRAENVQRSAKARLSPDEVVLIRNLLRDGEPAESVASMFGVTAWTIRAIRSRSIWGNVQDDNDHREKLEAMLDE